MTAATVAWTTAHDYQDVRYEHSGTGIARVTIEDSDEHDLYGVPA